MLCFQFCFNFVLVGFAVLCCRLMDGLMLLYDGGLMMDEAIFEKKLDELVREMNDLPSPQKQQLMSVFRGTTDNQKKLKKSVDQLQESLDYLRVCVKYLLFDLDATKRENEQLKGLLKDKS